MLHQAHPMDDRRRHPRVQARGLFAHLKYEGEVVLALPVVDLSLGGAFIAWDFPCADSANVMLELASPGAQALKLVGRVVGVVSGSSKRGVRLQFLSVRDDVSERLSALVQVYSTEAQVYVAPHLHEGPIDRGLFDFSASEDLAEGEVEWPSQGNVPLGEIRLVQRAVSVDEVAGKLGRDLDESRHELELLRLAHAQAQKRIRELEALLGELHVAWCVSR